MVCVCVFVVSVKGGSISGNGKAKSGGCGIS